MPPPTNPSRTNERRLERLQRHAEAAGCVCSSPSRRSSAQAAPDVPRWLSGSPEPHPACLQHRRPTCMCSSCCARLLVTSGSEEGMVRNVATLTAGGGSSTRQEAGRAGGREVDSHSTPATPRAAGRSRTRS
jgi:hypothetical protein